jgi:HPt (histidine-containing phosphotransfer) domain-containing protein
MDDYVTKPVRPDDVYAALSRVMERFPRRERGVTTGPGAETGSAATDSEAAYRDVIRMFASAVSAVAPAALPTHLAQEATPGSGELPRNDAGRGDGIGVVPQQPEFELVDLALLRDRTCDDDEFLQEMIGLFLKESPAMLEAVAAAVGAGDACRVNRTAHAVKGTIGNYTLAGPYEAALRLEHCGADGDLSQAGQLLAALRTQYELLCGELRSIPAPLAAAAC